MEKILIANRGEIALRVGATCRRLGIGTVAVYSEADRDAPHVRAADEAFCIGPASAEHSYLNIESILDAASKSGAHAVHPGYGFLSENSEFAAAVEARNLIWIGPTRAAMESMASKISARSIAMKHDVPVIPAYTLRVEDQIDSDAILNTIGLPMLVKSSAGGGGMGMRELHSAEDLSRNLEEAREQAQRLFGSADLLIERLLSDARHIEIQVVGDQQGNLIHLFERDCSSQRRRQKLLEETPAPGLPDAIRSKIQDAAVRLARAVDYQSVGTVEFLLSGDEFFLLEMNTRLQVEHTVTEAVTGLDLVELQIAIASGKPLALQQQDVHCRGHAIQARVYAEQPARGFLPATGTIESFAMIEQPQVRLDAGVDRGTQIGHHYDGLLCKIIVHEGDRSTATKSMIHALSGLQLSGVETNQAFLQAVMASREWQRGIQIETIERELEYFIAASQPSSPDIETVLMVATIVRFASHPPAADAAPWPGGYQFERLSSWVFYGRKYSVPWTWVSASYFEFRDFERQVQLLELDLAGGQLVVQVGEEKMCFGVTESGDALWLWHTRLGNCALKAANTDFANDTSDSDGQCKSHGPGQVLRTLVQAGQTVERGEPLIVIESMKMESTLIASASGKVSAVEVGEGDLIESGQILLRINTSED
ncbi:MAG: biotin carboxylase N-terminal domain-containing protein [Pseudomonadota bacterium]